MTVQKKGRSVTLKIIVIGFLALVLQIPGGMIYNLMRERQARRDEVIREVSSKWGAAQTIAGPFFTVPFKSHYKDSNNNLKFDIKYFHILPEQLDISGQIAPQVRRRGIYEAVIYNARLAVSGHFAVPSLEQLNIPSEDILWDKALFSVGISDLRGIQENVKLSFGGRSHEVAPGLKTADIASAGVSSGIALSPDSGPLAFSFQLNLNGSEQVQFVPLAKETTVTIRSSWPSPSFNGAFCLRQGRWAQRAFPRPGRCCI